MAEPLQFEMGNRQSAITLVSESLQNLTGVIFWLHLFENFFDLALLIDQKSGSMNTHVRSAHKLLLAPNAVSICNRMVLVGQKREGKFILGLRSEEHTSEL